MTGLIRMMRRESVVTEEGSTGFAEPAESSFSQETRAGSPASTSSKASDISSSPAANIARPRGLPPTCR